MIFVIGLAVLGAQKAGMLTAANVPPVLLAAYLAYAGGVALMVLVSRIYQRQLERAATAGQVESERQIAISDAGIVAKSANHDLRVTWHAVRSIDVRPDVVLIWLEWYQFIAVPTRAFADEAACVAFVTAVRDWIKTAPGSKRSVG
jgi:mRNA-degrading endonuclease YafQ of YafQ-DinJ toxin-antitoxin module